MMIINKLCRQLCTSVLYATAAKSNLTKRMLEPNSTAYGVFQTIRQTPELNLLTKLFQDQGYELRIAGGAVRDLLCGQHPNDLDFATTATPQQMIQIMKDKENIRLITTPSGERHGTVAARINDKEQYEITTLRIDKITDGRHAQVEFINDWKLDASRRDLTINSMFLGLDGMLYDYFDGQTDLKENNIRFVGDAAARIKEDYLRIFRYFRFHARYGHEDEHDEKTLITIKENLHGLVDISGERIWSELKRIFGLKSCGHAVHVMVNKVGIGKYIGLNDSHIDNDSAGNIVGKDLTEFDRVLANLKEHQSDWESATLLASIINDDEELLNVTARLKLSNFEKETILYIITNRSIYSTITVRDLKVKLALEAKSLHHNLKRIMIEYLKYNGAKNEVEEIANWEIPIFPIRGNIIGKYVKQRKMIGQVMNDLKLIWAKNDFELSDEDLESELQRLLKSEKYEKYKA